MKRKVGLIGLMGLIGLVAFSAMAADWSNPNPRSGGDSAGQLLLKHESNMSDLYNSTGKLNLLRENFAGVASPSLPETGQAWYDTGVQMLKLYGSATWGLPGFYSSGTSSLRNIVSTGTTTVNDFVSTGTATIPTLSTTGISATTGTFGTISAGTISAGSSTIANLNTTGTGTVSSLYATSATMPNISVTTKGTFVDLETSGTATLPTISATGISATTVTIGSVAIDGGYEKGLSYVGIGTNDTNYGGTGARISVVSSTSGVSSLFSAGNQITHNISINGLPSGGFVLYDGYNNGWVSGLYQENGKLVGGEWNATTIAVAYGGTGTTSLTGYVKGNGTSAFTASSLVPFSDLSGTATIGQGGTGAGTKTTAFDNLSPLTTKGDVIAHDGTNNVRMGVGGNGQVIMADSTQSSGMKWADVSSVPAGDAVTLSGFHVSTTPTATMIPATGSSGKLNNGWLNTGSGNGIDADKLDGQEGSYYTNASNISSGTIGTAYLPTGIPKANISSSGTWSYADIPSTTYIGTQATVSAPSIVDLGTVTTGQIWLFSAKSRCLGSYSSGSNLLYITQSGGTSLFAFSGSDDSSVGIESTSSSGIGTDGFTSISALAYVTQGGTAVVNANRQGNCDANMSISIRALRLK